MYGYPEVCQNGTILRILASGSHRQASGMEARTVPGGCEPQMYRFDHRVALGFPTNEKTLPSNSIPVRLVGEVSRNRRWKAPINIPEWLPLASRCAVGNSVECDFNRPTVKGQVTRGVAGDVWLGA